MIGLVLVIAMNTLPQCTDSQVFSNECRVLVGPGTTFTSNAQVEPACPDGDTLMADLSMRPKCVKGEIIEPIH